MRIKAGAIYLESGGMEDAVIEWDVGTCVDFSNEDGFLVLRISPEELLVIADHIVAEQKRNHDSESNTKEVA